MSTVETPVGNRLPVLWATSSPNDSTEVIETLHSWVMLTEHYAYKVRKSRDEGKVCSGTVESRHRACSDEVALNKRLAPSVYQGVLPITRDELGRSQLNGKGPVVDWAIKMRRLSEEHNLGAMLDNGQIPTKSQIQALGDVLASFYQSRSPETVVPDELYTRLERRAATTVAQLFKSLPSRWHSQLRRLRDAQMEYLQGARMVLNLRVCDGRIADGHGDLRPEHVYLERRPVVIDCYSESANRRGIDVLDDLGLFAMECERRERHDISDNVMSAYRRVTGDDGFPHLELFYKSLHACTASARAACAAEATDIGTHRLLLDQAAAYLTNAAKYAQVLV